MWKEIDETQELINNIPQFIQSIKLNFGFNCKLIWINLLISASTRTSIEKYLNVLPMYIKFGVGMCYMKIYWHVYEYNIWEWKTKMYK